MTPITKQQVEELIDRLASKELTFGQPLNLMVHKDWRMPHVAPSGKVPKKCVFMCMAKRKDSYYIWYPEFKEVACHPLKRADRDLGIVETLNDYKVLGHPILIGDVLEKILQTDDDCGGLETEEEVKECTALWYDCGLTKSLQEIAEGIEYWEREAYGYDEPVEPICVQLAKPSPATDLFQFLISTL